MLFRRSGRVFLVALILSAQLCVSVQAAEMTPEDCRKTMGRLARMGALVVAIAAWGIRDAQHESAIRELQKQRELEARVHAVSREDGLGPYSFAGSSGTTYTGMPMGTGAMGPGKSRGAQALDEYVAQLTKFSPSQREAELDGFIATAKARLSDSELSQVLSKLFPLAPGKEYSTLFHLALDGARGEVWVKSLNSKIEEAKSEGEKDRLAYAYVSRLMEGIRSAQGESRMRLLSHLNTFASLRDGLARSLSVREIDFLDSEFQKSKDTNERLALLAVLSQLKASEAQEAYETHLEEELTRLSKDPLNQKTAILQFLQAQASTNKRGFTALELELAEDLSKDVDSPVRDAANRILLAAGHPAAIQGILAKLESSDPNQWQMGAMQGEIPLGLYHLTQAAQRPGFDMKRLQRLLAKVPPQLDNTTFYVASPNVSGFFVKDLRQRALVAPTIERLGSEGETERKSALADLLQIHRADYNFDMSQDLQKLVLGKLKQDYSLRRDFIGLMMPKHVGGSSDVPNSPGIRAMVAQLAMEDASLKPGKPSLLKNALTVLAKDYGASGPEIAKVAKGVWDNPDPEIRSLASEILAKEKNPEHLEMVAKRLASLPAERWNGKDREIAGYLKAYSTLVQGLPAQEDKARLRLIAKRVGEKKEAWTQTLYDGGAAIDALMKAAGLGQ